MTTTYSNKLSILSNVWLDYSDDEAFKDFADYNDVGLPLAYILSNGIVENTEIAEKFINETYDLLIAGLGIEDTGFDNLQDILEAAS